MYPNNLEVMFAEVKHQFSQEEHEQVEKDETFYVDDVSPSEFVIMALELEETQQVTQFAASYHK
jgi:hypothetical protein